MHDFLVFSEIIFVGKQSAHAFFESGFHFIFHRNVMNSGVKRVLFCAQKYILECMYLLKKNFVFECMNLAIVGTGYVGLTTGALFAERGNTVVCVDKNPEVVETLRRGEVHFFEPGLAEIVKSATANGTLSFTTDVRDAVVNAQATFIAVGTPSDTNGAFNMKYVVEAAREIGGALREGSDFHVVVTKSTVPQGTWKEVSDTINSALGGSRRSWAYVANPETLAEGTAVRDFSKPDRVIIGTESDRAFEFMQRLYHPFVRQKGVIERGSCASAEMAKLGANTLLALRVAAVNELAHIADVTKGADMEEIRRMIGGDARIGYQFLFPSPGYGGSCFPKDVQGLVERAERDGYRPVLLSTIHRSNETHKLYMAERIAGVLSARSPTIAVWGLTFKPGTDDMRDAASVPIITHLVNEGVQVQAYDPQSKNARRIFGDRIRFADRAYDAVGGADALVLLTEWSQFDSPDYMVLQGRMRGRTLFDLRNRWQPREANEFGFDYFGVGRNYPLRAKQDLS